MYVELTHTLLLRDSRTDLESEKIANQVGIAVTVAKQGLSVEEYRRLPKLSGQVPDGKGGLIEITFEPMEAESYRMLLAVFGKSSAGEMPGIICDYSAYVATRRNPDTRRSQREVAAYLESIYQDHIKGDLKNARTFAQAACRGDMI